MAATSDLRGQCPRSRARTSDKTPGNSSFLFVFGWFRVVMVVWARLVGAIRPSSRRSNDRRGFAGLGFDSERYGLSTQMLAIVATMSVLVSTLVATPMSVLAADSTPPARPTGLTAPEVSHDSVTLNWEQADDADVTGFQVLRRDRDLHAQGEFEILADHLAATARSYMDDTVEPSKRYVYRVRARNGDALSPQSNYVRVDVPAAPLPVVPAAPTGLTAVPSWDRVDLVWDDAGDSSITGFQVLRGADADSLVVIESDAAGAYAVPFADSGVVAETTYVYAVQAFNDQGVGGRSVVVEVVTLEDPGLVVIPPSVVPAAPTGLAAVPSWDRVDLVWDDAGDSSITGFQVLRGADADSLVVIESDAAGAYAVPFADSGVVAETTYVYAVQAFNDQGVGGRSVVVEVVTLEDPGLVVIPPSVVPAAPTGLTVVPTWDRVDLVWDDAGDSTITGFQVLRGADADSLAVIESDAAGAYTVPFTDSGKWWRRRPMCTRCRRSMIRVSVAGLSWSRWSLWRIRVWS